MAQQEQVLQEFLQALAQEPACLVRVESIQGSAPREAGAWMAVWPERVLGTLGGGHLEWQAIALARARLAGTPGEPVLRFALGPSLGQCCGGVVHLRLRCVTQRDAPELAAALAPALAPVALFGGGHVGHALVQALAPLPFAVTWIDSRDGIFPSALPAGLRCEHSEPVQAAVADLAAGSHVLIMSFSHAEDLEIVAACLQRQRQRGDLPFIGLIGSHSKWARFGHRLQERGWSAQECAQVTCPIGVPGVQGKEPQVIAVAVAAQLLQLRVLSTKKVD